MHPHFPVREFSDRVGRLRTAMRERSVDIALLDEFEAMAWLSGYGNSENRWRCVGIPLEGAPFFLIRALDAGPCRQRIWFDDVVAFKDWEDPVRKLADILARRGLSRGAIGLDLGSYSMPAARFAAVQAALPGARFVDLGPLVNELRLIKSPAEVALLRKAAGIADEALRRAATACIPGGSQRAAAKAAMAAFVELGADPGGPGPISAGRGWDFLHAHPDEAALAKGDVVHLELVPRIGGYGARLMRCVTVGRPSPELARAAERLVVLQDRQIAAMRPGVIAEEVDAILREGVLATGLRESFDNITGYTLGFYSHATPRTSDFTRIFHPRARWRIEPGMVFHMYVSAAGASFSETVLVTEMGAERLTRLPRTLIVNE
ncbi:MAG TPA: Xaa-Pro peptidase family protein [Alphaproteobacteria bacterium]|nr:Xaa-Pro peptidase family protein [Alphaproteobacteria bacterium]